MGVSLPTNTAIIILALIAAVYFAITAVFLTCVCWCICNKKKCRARVKPIRDAYSPRHKKVYDDRVYTESTSFTSSSRTSVTTDASSSDVNGGLVLKNRSVVKRAKKSKDPYSNQEWQGSRDSAILQGAGHVLSTNTDQLSSEGTSSTGSDTQTQPEHTGESKKDLSAYSHGGSSMDQSLDRGSRNGAAGDDNDSVFEESTTVQVIEVEQNGTAVRPTFEERKQKKIAQRKKKKEAVFRTDSTKPLLNGSESRTQSETSDIGIYGTPAYVEPRPLTPMQEDQPPQPPSLTPLKITPRRTLTPITPTSKTNNISPSNHTPPSSIARGRPVLPKIGQNIPTPIKVEPAATSYPMVEDEEDNSLSVL